MFVAMLSWCVVWSVSGHLEKYVVCFSILSWFLSSCSFIFIFIFIFISIFLFDCFSLSLSLTSPLLALWSSVCLWCCMMNHSFCPIELKDHVCSVVVSWLGHVRSVWLVIKFAMIDVSKITIFYVFVCDVSTCQMCDTSVVGFDLCYW